MGESAEDYDEHRACADCARLCRTSHGMGLPGSVPRFSRPVPDYALPSAKDCNLQVPAFYVREHEPEMKGRCFLVGVTGAQWGVSFKDVAFRYGWKTFASDHKLAKGDHLVFALVAPKRFLVNVFDKFGMEKVSSRGSLSKKKKSPVALSPGKGSVANEHSMRKRPLSPEPAEAEPSLGSESSNDSASVRLAKEVLRKSEEKKRRRMSGGARSEGTVGTEELELCKNLEDRSDKGDENDIVMLESSHDGDANEATPDAGGESLRQKTTPADPNEDLDEAEAVRGVAREEPVLEPDHVFQPGLMKQEPELGVPEACKSCENCGRPQRGKVPVKLMELKPEPVTSEPRSPGSNAPSASTGRVTEDQKQRALVAARDFSATTTNRHAIVVMRVSFEDSHDCFVSLKCAEMLPAEAAELTLVNSKGALWKVDWNADKRHLQGPGWREFVRSHNLGLNDVFVLEVLERSPQRVVVLVHIFRAHEMEDSPVPGVARSSSSSLSTPATFRRDGTGEPGKLGGRSKQKAVRERHSLYAPHGWRREEAAEEQVPTPDSRKVEFPVVKMLGRRKSVQGVSFLVELGKPVSQRLLHKKMKCLQDDKGRWWVPQHHFTKDFTSCFLE